MDSHEIVNNMIDNSVEKHAFELRPLMFCSKK
jgi:hypothetical protein